MHVLFEVPGEPRGKGRPRFVRKSGRAYTPAETASYENLIRAAAAAAMGAAAPVEMACRVSVVAVCSVPASWSKKKTAAALSRDLRPTSKPDIDNIIKAVADALNGVVWKDDKQITDATLAKRYGERPHLAIEVRA